MRLLVISLLFILAACVQKNKQVELSRWKASANRQSINKVKQITDQLKKDCDSNLLQIARYKADSIRRARANKKRR